MNQPPSATDQFSRIAGGLRVVRRMVQTVLGITAAILLLTLVLFEIGSRCVSLPAPLLHPQGTVRDILDRNGNPLRLLPRSPTQSGNLSELPLHIKQALLAAEDRRFLSHSGIDLLRIIRASWDNIRAHRIVSGASTITQQLIKISTPPEQRPKKRGLAVKIVEACAARKLERQWSKNRILCEYANRLDLGFLNTGIQSASQFYFGKEPQYLSTAEAALLVGIAQAPTRLNPIRHPKNAKARQERVLQRMCRFGLLPETELERTLRYPIQTTTAGRPFLAPHFVDLLFQRGISSDTNSVTTSLDLELQKAVENSVHQHLRNLTNQRVTQAAAVVIDNRTGEVLALVGSAGYDDSPSGQVNGAWAPRSPGSALKPFTYLLALDSGISAASPIPDIPSVFETTAGSYVPENFDRQFRGPVLMRSALANSLNIPAVAILDALGGPKILCDKLKQYGITTLRKSPGHYGLGLTIGNPEVRLLELTNAYAGLARLDFPAPFTLLRSDPQIPLGASPNAWLIADILADNSARSATFGRRSALHFDFPVACKTGTSTSFRDNWAFGFTPEFTVGVWAGNFNGAPMLNVSGVTGAAPILHEIFEILHQSRGTTWYTPPPGWTQIPIHRVLGKQDTADTATLEWFPQDRLPQPVTPEDFSEDGRILLPPSYAEWLGPENNHLKFTARKLEEVTIRHPRHGTRFIHDPDTPDSEWIFLRADGPNSILWESPTLRFRQRGNSTQASGIPGKHEVIARDSVTGKSSSVTFEIVRW